MCLWFLMFTAVTEMHVSNSSDTLIDEIALSWDDTEHKINEIQNT